MSTRGLCWCGLNRESHDGREMDAEGRMHKFGEPVHDLNRVIVWLDPESPSGPEALDIRKIK